MYCRRDLRTPALGQGAKAAAVLSVLYVFGVLTGNVPMNGAELVNSLTVGLLWTFLIWWVACTLIILSVENHPSCKSQAKGSISIR